MPRHRGECEARSSLPNSILVKTSGRCIETELSATGQSPCRARCIIGLVAAVRPRLENNRHGADVCGRNLVTPRLSAAAPAAPAACDVGGDPRGPRRGSAAWALTSSLDHLVGKLLELRWHIKAESRGGLRQDCCPLNASGRPTLPDQSRSLVVTDCTDVGRRPPRQINHDSLSTRWLTACYRKLVLSVATMDQCSSSQQFNATVIRRKVCRVALRC
jgi:hypothetical protein